jgi:integrase
LPKASEFVFPSPKTNGKLDNVKRSFNRAKSDAKITDFHFHDLRHTFATRLVDAGVSITVLAELLGHSDIRMTKRYAHATEKSKRDAVRVLSKRKRVEQVLSKMPKMKIAASA